MNPKTFSPVTVKCQLCMKEKYYILIHIEWPTQNSKNEIYANSRHKNTNMLIRPIRNKKKKKREARPFIKKVLIFAYHIM